MGFKSDNGNVIKMLEGKMTLIAAVAVNGVIGSCGKIPWEKIPEDMKRFRKLTLDHAVVMGRKTYEALGKPLEGRFNIVITRQPDSLAPVDGKLAIFERLDGALNCAERYAEGIFYVIGGSEVYAQTINQANELRITEVKQVPRGDSYFPEIKSSLWNETEREDKEGYSFVTYSRRS